MKKTFLFLITLLVLLIATTSPKATVAQRQEEVRARRVVLADDVGRERLVLTLNPLGTPHILFNDTEGNPRLQLALSSGDDSPQINLIDPHGAVRLRAWLFGSTQRPILWLLDGGQKVRLAIELDYFGNPQITQVP